MDKYWYEVITYGLLLWQNMEHFPRKLLCSSVWFFLRSYSLLRCSSGLNIMIHIQLPSLYSSCSFSKGSSAHFVSLLLTNSTKKRLQHANITILCTFNWNRKNRHTSFKFHVMIPYPTLRRILIPLDLVAERYRQALQFAN